MHPRVSRDYEDVVKRKLLPQIVRLTPSNFADFIWCPRIYYTSVLLRVPPSDTGGFPDQGLLVHDVLERVHVDGSCHDADHVARVLRDANADTQQMRGYVARHERRCPQQFDQQAHEVDRVRFHREPKPMFLATARIDAVWIHDGVLDARDYKSGTPRDTRLADDPRARVQAWVLARDAARTGLRLRLRYEYLQPEADDDPDPWEPDDDDLAAIDDELRDAVERMWFEEEWNGVADPDVCRTCRYRSICRDSAAPGEAAWPVLASEGER
jgi:hypothetical protein